MIQQRELAKPKSSQLIVTASLSVAIAKSQIILFYQVFYQFL